MKLSGIEIVSIQERERFLCMLLWGDSGAGKTTLAASAPGRKLFLNFDPNGTDSLDTDNPLIKVADFSSAPDRVIDNVKERANPFGLKAVIDDFDTIVMDGLTNLQYMAVMHGITDTKSASVDNPTMKGYQKRNAAVLAAQKNILKLCQQAHKHVIFIAHAAAPRLNDDGAVVAQSIALGGQLVSQVPVDFSEVWCLVDKGNRREILLRPAQFMRPCKSRMFDTKKASFIWRTTGTELTDWYEAWKLNKWKKLPLPSTTQ